MATSSTLCRAALLAAAAPSIARGGGVRRLPAGRCCRAPSAAGFRGVGFITLSTTTMTPPPKPRITMLACAKATKSDWDSYERDEDEVAKEVDKHYAELSPRSFGDKDDEFDKYYASLCKQTEEAMIGHFIEVPFEVSEEESALQNKLKEIAQRCMDLQADAMRRLCSEQRRPLYLPFRTTHFAFTSVKVRAMVGHAKWGVSSLLIVHKLDVLRKMVSSACSAALPLDRDKQEFSLLPPLVEEAIGGLVGVESNSQQEVALALIEYTYNTVKSDIDEMFTKAEVFLVIKLEEVMNSFLTPMHPQEQMNLTDKEAKVLSCLREIAGRGYLLVTDVSRQMRPEPESALFNCLCGVGSDFVGLMKLIYSPMGLSAMLVARLDSVRRIVSSACDIPLPAALISPPDESTLGDMSTDEEVVYLVRTFCQNVEDDVKAIISAGKY